MTPPAKRAPRPLVVAALIAATVASVATRSPQQPPGADDYMPFTSQLYLYNGSGDTRLVRIRDLNSGVQLDCEAVAAEPHRLLTDELFAPANRWEQVPNGRTPVAAASSGPCGTAIIDGDEQPRALLFWSDSQLGTYDVISTDADEPGERGIAQWWEDDRFLEYDDGGSGLIVPPTPAVPSDVCELNDRPSTLEWTTPPPSGAVITEVSVGLDGCLAVETSLQSSPWMVCMPEGAWPFEAGDELQLSASSNRLVVDTDDGRWLYLGLGLAPEGWHAELVPSDCAPAVVDDGCGTVLRTAQLALTPPDGERQTIRPGTEPASIGTANAWVSNAVQAVVSNPSCSEDTDFSFQITLSQDYQ